MATSETYNKCITDFVKYRGTATVLAAVRRILDEHSEVAKFVGVEYTILTLDKKEITPDLSSSYGSGSGALLFELKWSISSKTIQDELLELRKYKEARFTWKSGKPPVKDVDVVLICHVDDIQTVSSAIDELLKSSENNFLSGSGLAIWTWGIIMPKGAGSGAVEEMRLQCVRGKTANVELEKLVRVPGGLRIPHEVLRFLRYKYLFTKEKPPVQYIMAVLMLHVFTSFQQNTHRSEVLTVSHGLLDTIYDRAKTFFPGWHHATEKTIQTKKIWMREAINRFVELKMNIVRLPLPRTKKQVHESICGKLERLRKKPIRILPAPRKKKKQVPTASERKITEFY